MPPTYVAPTLVDAVRALARDGERGFAFVRPDGTERLIPFGAIAAEAEERAGHLAARGLRKGDRLAMVVPDGDEFVLSFLGALFAGVVPVPIFPQLSFKNIESYHDTVAHIARASGAKALLTTPKTKPFVAPAAARLPALEQVVTVDELAGPAPRPAGVKVAPGDLAFLQFTSGSTSRPKGVMVTHANLAANAEAFMIHGITRDPARDKGVSWLPLFHDMGLIGFVVGPLFTNVPCVFMPTASFVRAPRLWLEKLHEHRGTITYAPSFAYALVAKRIKERDVEGLDLSCVRVAGCGAEPVQARALRDFAERLRPTGFDPRAFLPSYGMAEATLAVTFIPLGEGLKSEVNAAGHEIVDCGRAFPEHEIAIVDESGRRVGERVVGQVVTRGPSVTLGYYEEPAMTADTMKPLAGEADGGRWLYTGDLGYLVGGHLFVCGRVKDMIIVRGRNYFPSDIEWAVGDLPGVRRGNAVAFGVDVDGEEQVVVCCEGAQADAAGIRDAVSRCVAERFGLSVHEVCVVPLTALPRTSSGKPQRRKTRTMYLEGTWSRSRPAADAAEPPEAPATTSDTSAA